MYRERVVFIVVIIPAYEPDQKLIDLLKEIRSRTDYKVVIVNDGSSIDKNDVFSSAKEYGTVLAHKENRGKGRAIKTALEFIGKTLPGETGAVVADADGQHKVSDMIKICDGLKADQNNIVIGSRQFSGKVPFRSRFGNTITRHVFSAASGIKLNDTQTGLRAFSTALIPFLLRVKGERYEYEMNMLLECAENKVNITEIPIETVYLDHNASSHFRSVVDSARIYKEIIKFSCSSLLSFIIDFTLFSILIILTKNLNESISITISNVTARVFSSSFNFYINKTYVFRSKENTLKAAVKYFGLAVCIMIGNTLILHVLYEYMIGSKLISKLITEIILFIISLTVQRLFVFKSKERKVLWKRKRK